MTTPSLATRAAYDIQNDLDTLVVRIHAVLAAAIEFDQHGRDQEANTLLYFAEELASTAKQTLDQLWNARRDSTSTPHAAETVTP